MLRLSSHLWDCTFSMHSTGKLPTKMVLNSFSASSSTVNTFLAFFFVSASNSSAFLYTTRSCAWVCVWLQNIIHLAYLVCSSNQLSGLLEAQECLVGFLLSLVLCLFGDIGNNFLGQDGLDSNFTFTSLQNNVMVSMWIQPKRRFNIFTECLNKSSKWLSTLGWIGNKLLMMI